MFAKRDQQFFRRKPVSPRAWAAAVVSGAAFVAVVLTAARGSGANGGGWLSLRTSRLPSHAKLHGIVPVLDADGEALDELGQHALYATLLGRRESFWHSPRQLAVDAQAQAVDRLASFLCEIPAGTRAKMETHKALPHNPILQDVKKGALRSYPMPLGVSYGALPQTYEYPLAAGSGGTGGDAFTGLAGDGDPLDALDLSSAVALTADGRDVAEDDGATGSGPRGWGVPLPSTGDVYPVRLIGALAMVDGGEADWKLLAVRTDDPLLGGVTDVAQLVGPDRVLTLQELLQQRPGVPATYTADARAKGRAGAAAALTDAARAAGRARVDQATRFFLSYKKADPWDVAEPSPVTLAFGGRLLDAPAAMAVARQGHLHWCALMGAVLHHARVQGIVEPAKLARLKGRLVACAAVGADPSSLGTGPPPPVPDGVWV